MAGALVTTLPRLDTQTIRHQGRRTVYIFKWPKRRIRQQFLGFGG